MRERNGDGERGASSKAGLGFPEGLGMEPNQAQGTAMWTSPSRMTTLIGHSPAASAMATELCGTTKR